MSEQSPGPDMSTETDEPRAAPMADTETGPGGGQAAPMADTETDTDGPLFVREDPAAAASPAAGADTGTVEAPVFTDTVDAPLDDGAAGAGGAGDAAGAGGGSAGGPALADVRCPCCFTLGGHVATHAKCGSCEKVFVVDEAIDADLDRKGSLGKGSFGDVALEEVLVRREGKEDLRGGRFAVKDMNREDKLQREAYMHRLAMKGDHRGILRFIGVSAGTNRLVTEHLANGDLRHFLDDLRAALEKGGKFATTYNDRKAKIFKHLAAEFLSAMEHLDGLGMVHHDLKPGNMGFDQHMQLRVFDFGEAWHSGSESEYPRAHCAGTPAFAPPEYQMAPDTRDHKSDIFSVGMILRNIAREGFYELHGTFSLPGEDAGSGNKAPSAKLVEWMCNFAHDKRPSATEALADPFFSDLPDAGEVRSWLQEIKEKLREGGGVAGNVVDQQGVPVQGARVYVQGGDDSVCVLTDAAGAFCFRGLTANETLTLEARHDWDDPEQAATSEPIKVEAGITVPLSADITAPEGWTRRDVVILTDRELEASEENCPCGFKWIDVNRVLPSQNPQDYEGTERPYATCCFVRLAKWAPADVFRRLGYQCHVVSSEDEAKAAVEKFPTEIVLCHKDKTEWAEGLKTLEGRDSLKICYYALAEYDSYGGTQPGRPTWLQTLGGAENPFHTSPWISRDLFDVAYAR